MALTIETMNKHQLSLLAQLRAAGEGRKEFLDYTLSIHKLLQWMETQGLVRCWSSRDWNEIDLNNWEITTEGQALLSSIKEAAHTEAVPGTPVDVEETQVTIIGTSTSPFPTREEREQIRIAERAEREVQRQKERDQRHLEMTEGWILQNIIAPVLRAEWERKQPSWKSTHTVGEFARMPRQDKK